MTWYQALILGIIQGLTEFLPVSSSGHLEIGSVLLGVHTHENLLFAIVVHAATALSTILVFRNDLGMILRDLLTFKWNESYDYVVKIGISMVPVGVVGVLYEDQIASFFTGNMLLVGGMLIITAMLLFFTYFKSAGQRSVGYFGAVVIGCAQAFAILPGISRSGSTIAMALILGVERTKAARFSFLMVLIPILGASALKIKAYISASEVTSMATEIPGSSLVLGFVAAFVSGYLACRWMLEIVRRGKLTYFGFYCLAIGLVAIISTLL